MLTYSIALVHHNAHSLTAARTRALLEHFNQSILKASLNRYNIVSTAECECGDGLQTVGHIFWDCNLYEDKRETMLNIFS
jgi:hypothetical protein